MSSAGFQKTAWLVDTSGLTRSFKGIAYRSRPELAANAVAPDGSKIVPNGTLLEGEVIHGDDHSSWLALRNGLFVPLQIDGQTVLQQQTLQDEMPLARNTNSVSPSSVSSNAVMDEESSFLVDTTREFEALMGRSFKGVSWRSSVALASKAVNPTDGSSMAFNASQVSGKIVCASDGSRWLQVMEGLYLPCVMQGCTVLWPIEKAVPLEINIVKPKSSTSSLEKFRVDTSRELHDRIGKELLGVNWRGSAKLQNKVLASDGSKLALNGTEVQGVLMQHEDATSWLFLENGLYLPTHVLGCRILWPMAKEESQCPADTSQDVPCEEKLPLSSQTQNWTMQQANDYQLEVASQADMERRDAEQNLNLSLREGSLSAIEAAISRAEKAGVRADLIQSARTGLVEAKAKQDCEEAYLALSAAMASAREDCRPRELNRSIPQSNGEWFGGINMLSLLEGKSDQVDATASKLENLHSAIKCASQAGVAIDVLREAHTLLAGLEERRQAHNALTAALKENSIPVLQIALDRAIRAGVSDELVANASHVLAVTQQKESIVNVEPAAMQQVTHTTMEDHEVIDLPESQPKKLLSMTAGEIPGSAPSICKNASTLERLLDNVDETSLTCLAPLPPRPPSKNSCASISGVPRANSNALLNTSFEDEFRLPHIEAQDPQSSQDNQARGCHVGSHERAPPMQVWGATADADSSEEDDLEGAILDGALELMEAPSPSNCSCLPYARTNHLEDAVLPMAVLSSSPKHTGAVSAWSDT